MWRVSYLLSGVDQACHTTGKLVFVILENNWPEQKTRNKKASRGLAALHALRCGLVWMQLDFSRSPRDQMTSHRHSRQRSVHRRCERALSKVMKHFWAYMYARTRTPAHVFPAHMHAHTFPRPVDSSANLLLLFMSISSCCYFSVISSVCIWYEKTKK